MSDLKNFAGNLFSQTGEDGILREVFRIIGTKNKWCVEFGAGDGEYNSNTRTLIKDGWNSVQIEADPEKYDKLVQNVCSDKVICLNEIVGWEDYNSLDFILGNTKCPVDPDFISIDVDGNDWYIWDSIKEYRPRVVLVEFNPTFPPSFSYVQPKDMECNIGNSLLALVQLGKTKGYSLIACTDWNALFCIKEEFSKFNIIDNSPECLWLKRCYLTYLAFGYDGQAIVGGNTKLIWCNKVIDFVEYQKQVQVLTPDQLGYDGSIN